MSRFFMVHCADVKQKRDMSQDTMLTDYKEHDDDNDLSLTVEDDLECPPSLNDKPWSQRTNE